MADPANTFATGANCKHYAVLGNAFRSGCAFASRAHSNACIRRTHQICKVRCLLIACVSHLPPLRPHVTITQLSLNDTPSCTEQNASSRRDNAEYAYHVRDPSIALTRFSRRLNPNAAPVQVPRLPESLLPRRRGEGYPLRPLSELSP